MFGLDISRIDFERNYAKSSIYV